MVVGEDLQISCEWNRYQDINNNGLYRAERRNANVLEFALNDRFH